MKRFSRFLITIALILLFSGSSWVDIEIKAQVDKNKLTTDELLTYKLTVASATSAIPRPILPKFEGFSIVSQAESATVSLVKSRIKKIIVFAFILAPNNPGKFKIEPSQIKLEGKAYQTDAFDIEVTQGKNKPIPPPQEEVPQTTL